MARDEAAGALAILLLAGCTSLPAPVSPSGFRPLDPGPLAAEGWSDDSSAGGAPPATGEREWSAFVSAGIWWVDSDGNGKTPSGRADGPDGDGSAFSIRGGATFDIPRKPQEGVLPSSNVFGVPEGWRPCWGIEAEYTATETSGGGADDASLHVSSYSLRVPLGARKPGLLPGEDEHRFDLYLGAAYHDLRIDSRALDSIGADDSVSVGTASIGLRGHTTVSGPVLLFADVEYGGLSDWVAEDSTFGTESASFVATRLGAGVRLGRGVTLQAGWRGLFLRREEDKTEYFLFVPVGERDTLSKVDVTGPFVELVYSF